MTSSRLFLLLLCVLLFLGIGGVAYFLFFGSDQGTPEKLILGAKENRKPSLKKSLKQNLSFEDKQKKQEPGAAKDSQPLQNQKESSSIIEEKAPVEEHNQPEEIFFLPARGGLYGHILDPWGRKVSAASIFLLIKQNLFRRDQVHENTQSQVVWTEVARAQTEDDGFYAIGLPEFLQSIDGFDVNSRGFSPTPLQPGNYRLEIRTEAYAFFVEEFRLAQEAQQRDCKLEKKHSLRVLLEVVNTDGSTPRPPSITVVGRDNGYSGEKQNSRFQPEKKAKVPTSGALKKGEYLRTFNATQEPGSSYLFSFQLIALPHLELRIAQQGYLPLEPEAGVLNYYPMPGEEEVSFKCVFQPASQESTLRPSPYTGSASLRGYFKVLGQDNEADNFNYAAARVRLIYPDGAERSYRLENTGSFEITDLPEQAYTLYFSHAELTNQVKREIELKGHQEIEVVVQRSKVVLALEPSQLDLFGAIISVENTHGKKLFYRSLTKEERAGHHFEQTNWAPGDYYAKVSVAGGNLAGAEADGRLWFQVLKNRPSQRISLQVVKAHELRFQVLDEQGRGWAGAECRLLLTKHYQEILQLQTQKKKIDWEKTRLIQLDNLGNGRVKNLSPGEYTLLVWNHSRDPDRWDFSKAFSCHQDKDLGRLLAPK